MPEIPRSGISEFGNTRRVAVVWFVAILSVALPGAHGQEPNFPKTPLRASELFVPHELGQVSQIREATNADASTKLLILIQDAHVNYEAQKHLADILDRLISAYGVKLVLVEGGEGDIGLSYLRERGSKAVRQQLAEEYLRSGVLSGEEYLDIVSEHPMTLWGIDDPALYDEHMQTFLELEESRKTTEQGMAQLRQAVERLKANAPNDALREFEAQQASFDAGTLNVSDYVNLLLRESERLGVKVDGYQNLQRLVDARKLEEQVKPDQVAQEQRQAVGRLRGHATEQELAHLKETADRLKAKQVDPSAFYQELESLMQRAGLRLTDFPHLADYTRYMRLKAELQPKVLWAEMGELQRQVKAKLASSSSQAELSSLGDRVTLCERLLKLDWTPEDYEAYRRQPEQIRISQWLRSLKQEAARLGVSVELPADSAVLDATLARAVRFYETAQKRDAELMRRTLDKMNAEHQQLAVVIAGGFHTDHLIDLFAKQSMHVAVVTPLAGQDHDEARYADVLKAKYRMAKERASLPARFDPLRVPLSASTLEEAARNLFAEDAWDELDEPARQEALRQAAQRAGVKLAWYDPDAKTLEEATARLSTLSQNIHKFTETLSKHEVDVVRLDPAWFTGGILYGKDPNTAFSQLQAAPAAGVVVINRLSATADPGIPLQIKNYLEQVWKKVY